MKTAGKKIQILILLAGITVIGKQYLSHKNVFVSYIKHSVSELTF